MAPSDVRREQDYARDDSDCDAFEWGQIEDELVRLGIDGSSWSNTRAGLHEEPRFALVAARGATSPLFSTRRRRKPPTPRPASNDSRPYPRYTDARLAPTRRSSLISAMSARWTQPTDVFSFGDEHVLPTPAACPSIVTLHDVRLRHPRLLFQGDAISSSPR